MRFLSQLCCLAAFVVPTPVFASPVHIDVPGAHVIVVRPIDTWAGNRASAEYSLDGLKAKKSSFYYDEGNGKRIRSSIGPSSSPAPTPMERLFHEGLNAHGFTNNGPSGVSFVLGKSVAVPPEQMSTWLSVQDGIFREYVARLGNPATLPDRIKLTKVFNIAATLAFLNVGMDKLGNIDGANLIFTLALPEGLAKLTLDQRLGLAAVPAPDFDFSGFAAVEVRRLTNGSDRVGQIIIAYKNSKSTVVEDAALAAALVTATGADTTVEAVSQARIEDLALRQGIWDACVVAGRCK